MEALLKFIFALVALVFALIPMWVYLFATSMMNPEGFWQQLVMAGLALWFLGGLQVALLILWIIMVLYLIAN